MITMTDYPAQHDSNPQAAQWSQDEREKNEQWMALHRAHES
jgi:hypothetical protein